MAGFASDRAVAVLSAFFWGGAAAQRSRPWFAWVASNDNPADCLRKDGLTRAHLRDAIWEECNLAPFWDAPVRALQSMTFPKFQGVGELFKIAFQ